MVDVGTVSKGGMGYRWRYVVENGGMGVKNEVAEGSDPGILVVSC